MVRASDNPYDPPNEEAESVVDRDTPRFAIVGGEMVIVAAINGALIGLLFPAVEAAREANGSGPMFPDLMWLHERTFPLPIIVCSVAFASATYVAFSLLRFIAPPKWKRYLPWRQNRRRTTATANQTLDRNGRSGDHSVEG